VSNAVSIIALALSLLTSVVAVTTVIVQMRTTMGNLAERHLRQEEREDRAAKDVAEMFVLLKSFIAEQTVINKTMTSALEGTIKKLEDMDKRTVESSTVVALLTEIIGRKSVKIEGINIEPTHPRMDQ
jgi:uncharacterized protein (UPF0147 family)